MPHLIVEYTDNLGDRAAIPALLAKANAVLIDIEVDGKKVYPLGGVRSRAVRLTEYCVADGSIDAGFVHATLKIGSGRSEEIKRKTGEALFEMIKTHFVTEFAQRGLALSFELLEFSEAGSLKHNNLHTRLARS